MQTDMTLLHTCPRINSLTLSHHTIDSNRNVIWIALRVPGKPDKPDKLKLAKVSVGGFLLPSRPQDSSALSDD